LLHRGLAGRARESDAANRRSAEDAAASRERRRARLPPLGAGRAEDPLTPTGRRGTLELHGRSLRLPSCQRGDRSRFLSAGVEFHKAPAHYGYRTRRHKLIYFYNDGLGLPGTGAFTYPGEWELYDLETDPHELRNVATDPAYADVLADMRRRLRRAQLAVDDQPHPSEPALP